MSAVRLTYYSDLLCIWAYVAQARIEAVKETFGRDVEIEHRFCSVFGDAREKLTAAWRDRDGLAGYSRHVHSIAAKFSHARVGPDAWLNTQPASSASPHFFLAAMRTLQPTEPGAAHEASLRFDNVMWAFRRGFFEDGLDISTWDVQCALAQPFDVDLDAVSAAMRDGTAFASLSGDYREAERIHIEGSPTIVLNEGRQKLFGNVGFRIIDANIRELLREPSPEQASWC